MSGRPAFGFTMRSTSVISESFFTIQTISPGPNEQFIPIAETPSPCTIFAKDSMLTPAKVLPSFSKVIVTKIGLSVVSRAAKIAAFTSRRSVIVSITIMSTLSFAASTTSLKMEIASSNLSVPSGSSISPIGPMSSATFAPVFSAQAFAFLVAAATTSLVFSAPSFRLFAPKVHA